MSRAGIRAMACSDGAEVLRIFGEGIASGTATFETTIPAWEAWDAGHLAEHRYVAEDSEDGRLRGWAALSPVSDRCVYGGVAEVSVYVSAHARGAGVGRALLSALVTSSEGGGVWTLQAGVFPENVASLRLHRACGFREVGVRERLGQLAGRWYDVVLLERRSPAVG